MRMMLHQHYSNEDLFFKTVKIRNDRPRKTGVAVTSAKPKFATPAYVHMNMCFTIERTKDAAAV